MRVQRRPFPPLRTLVPLLLGLLLTLGAAQGPAFAAKVDRHQAGHTPKVTASPSRSADRAPRLPAVEGWSGFAFDACRAPSRRAMDAWRKRSPFRGVGVYIGGALRACPQRHLTRGWVSHQLRSGWKLLPIWVGPQASCTGFSKRIGSRQGARGRYPVAHSQGLRAARGARAAARSLGLPSGSTLWYDLEGFTPGNQRCRRSALSFLSAWTEQLHRTGYRSGVYSSVSSGINALSSVRGVRRYAAPDHVWFAWANYRANTSMDPYVRAPRWKQHRRVHQFALDVRASYGGVRMDIDRNFVDLGRPWRTQRMPARCGPSADLRSFPRLTGASAGRRVEVAECLLRSAGHLRERAGRDYDSTTKAAVARFQGAHHLPRTGRTTRRTWTALLAAGAHPVVKRGSAGPSVRRLQRALNAAVPGSIDVSGFLGAGTADTVRRYQARVGIVASGVVTPPTWRALSQGRIGHAPHRHGHLHQSTHHEHPGNKAHAKHAKHQRHAHRHGGHRHGKHHKHRHHHR
jgi:hypothetical protein